MEIYGTVYNDSDLLNAWKKGVDSDGLGFSIGKSGDTLHKAVDNDTWWEDHGEIDGGLVVASNNVSEGVFVIGYVDYRPFAVPFEVEDRLKKNENKS